MARTWLLGCIAALVLGCGHHSGGDSDANGTGDDADPFAGEPDAFEAVIDAPPFSGTCSPTGSAQCANCMDDDGDTKVDGFDPECSGPQDNDESSFATGIPGDNMDATYQDCFFDGDSGGGNDGCSQHVCCLLQAANITECEALAPNSHFKQYKKAECYMPVGSVPVPSKCTMNCGPLSPPGCDCFGCCTVCNGDGTTCRNIAINPAISPNCDQNNVNDPGVDGQLNTADDPCKGCTINTNCGGSACGPNAADPCIVCPGETIPPGCGGMTNCPTGYTECTPDSNGNPTCPAGSYCTNGCCVGDVIL